jgi:hypothetical protein
MSAKLLHQHHPEYIPKCVSEYGRYMTNFSAKETEFCITKDFYLFGSDSRKDSIQVTSFKRSDYKAPQTSASSIASSPIPHETPSARDAARLAR